MKKSTILLLILGVSVGLCTLASGCGKDSDSDSIKRARLVGNENIELRKQLKEKDAEIQKFENTIAKKDQEIAEIQEQTGDTTLKMMKNMMESGKQAEELAAENIKLKDRIKQLEAQLAEK